MIRGIQGDKQAGAVSLFVVIFSMLLLTVVTVSFLRLMMGDLRQASDTDLSQSAYDSAQAGVEDAKRALLRYQAYCNTTTESNCNTLAGQLSSDTCNEAVRIGGVVPGSSGEVSVRTRVESTTSTSFDQAYACVTMKLNTENVIGKLDEGVSKFVALKGVGNFNQVTISWFDQKDLALPSTPISLISTTTPLPLNTQTSAGWPTERPPIVRAQVMQTGTNFTLQNFDFTSGGQSNTNTLFLYPTSDGAASASYAGRDTRASSVGGTPPKDSESFSPQATACRPSVATGGYACSITLDLPDVIGGGTRQGYLRLTPFYKGASFEVRLSMNGVPVDFRAVQPAIDATGRANDLYRRVESRVELMDSSLPLPEAAVDVTTEFCKDFTVSDAAYTQVQCTYN